MRIPIHILALNAAVEAARAGKRGGGFAVVASEVRTGAGVLRQAGQDMRVLPDSAGGVSTLIDGIPDAALQWSVGVGDVGAANGELDRMTQQNSALVEQVAAIATSSHEGAGQLAAAVSRLRLPADAPEAASA